MTKRRLSIALASSAAAVAGVLALVPGATPAAAAVVDQGLGCGIGGNQTMKIEGTAPSNVAADGTFTVTLAPKAAKVSGSAIKNLEWAFQAPSGSQVVAGSATTVGAGTTTGGSIGTPSAAISGNTVFLRITGKIANNATFIPPAVRFDVKATGTVGTQLPMKVRTSGTAYSLTADLGNTKVNCNATNPISSFTNTAIVGGTTTTTAAVTTTTTGGGSTTTVPSTTTTTAAPPVITTETWIPTGDCGSVQTKVVPAGTTSAALVAVGGKGGKGGQVAGATGGSGRDGGRITATATPAPGTTISAIVGCQGVAGSSSSGNGGAGFSPGGNGGKGSGVITSNHYGGGGGGASAICTGPNCTTTMATPLVVAAGGGAGGSLNCAGTNVGAGGLGGAGAMTPAPAAAGTGPSGNSGEGTSRSLGGVGGVNNVPGLGRGGHGGHGSGGSGTNAGGGGGGGGYVGGAGGTGSLGGGGLCNGGAGGGGGSSFAATSTTSVGFATANTASVNVTFTISTVPTDPTDPVDDGSVYVPLVPCRILDTRNDGGALGNGAAKAIQVTGRPTCKVPAKATAVEASVSAVEPTALGFARLWPTGATPPAATFVNYSKAQGTTNTGAISVNSSGSMSLKNFGGPSHYTIDLQGYYIAPADLPAATVGSVYVAMKPCRILDTRNAGGALANGKSLTVPVTGRVGCSVPAKATAVEASASAVDPTALGFARLWPKGAPAPTATFVNFSKAQGTTNTGAISLGSGGQLALRNFGGPANYTLDIQGYFIDPADLATSVIGSTYHALVPCRVYDSRSADGLFTPNESTNRTVTGSTTPCGIATGATAVEASVSASEPVASGFTRLWPRGGSPATATFVNYTKAKGTTNTGSISLSTTGGVTLENFRGTTHYVIDVQGYWKAVPASADN